MVGCGECGAFGKLTEVTDQITHVVDGVRYVGKVGALRCKKCGSLWHDAEEDADFRRAVVRVAKGLDAERANDFDVRRAAAPSPPR